ncbi:glutamine amidotransferase [Magnetospira sp. QH-2]|uniref:glutamine amidotransferase n=1 Tax=Magnetospira sp. (strain QH-2) TaxID=1288970 RepID=UPI0003E816D9|nr:glutamine amidotransferase [Magnetospira sp. QH-2]CCQ73362.1 Putative GMP synthase-Glutamine amidotransferase [Magnetospira sp. QH-2]
MKSAIALRHVTFEDLDLLGPLLTEQGFAVSYMDAWQAPLLDPLAADLLVVLGGPIGVYEEDHYPYLGDELKLIEARLKANRPVLGICLGCQLMARALGSRVYASGLKEIGWAPIELNEEGRHSVLAPLGEGSAHVLHWHGDTFDLPEGARHLARSARIENQAFSWGDHALALQFHVEATALGLERWYVGHALEIATTEGIDPNGLRADAAAHGPRCNARGERFMRDWLDSLDLD